MITAAKRWHLTSHMHLQRLEKLYIFARRERHKRPNRPLQRCVDDHFMATGDEYISMEGRNDITQMKVAKAFELKYRDNY
jgi:hypothetical protein